LQSGYGPLLLVMETRARSKRPAGSPSAASAARSRKKPRAGAADTAAKAHASPAPSPAGRARRGRKAAEAPPRGASKERSARAPDPRAAAKKGRKEHAASPAGACAPEPDCGAGAMDDGHEHWEDDHDGEEEEESEEEVERDDDGGDDEDAAAQLAAHVAEAARARGLSGAAAGSAMQVCGPRSAGWSVATAAQSTHPSHRVPPPRRCCASWAAAWRTSSPEAGPTRA